MNRIDRKIKNIEKKIEKLYKERAKEFFNADETKYWQINSLLNKERKFLQFLIDAKVKYNLTGSRIERSKRCYGFVRWETLDESYKKDIIQLYHKFGYIYVVKGYDCVVCLRDAVSFIDSI